MPEPLFDKATGLRLATLLKKRLWHRCFPLNFAKFFRTPIFTEHRWLILPFKWIWMFCKNLKKNLQWMFCPIYSNSWRLIFLACQPCSSYTDNCQSPCPSAQVCSNDDCTCTQKCTGTFLCLFCLFLVFLRKTKSVKCKNKMIHRIIILDKEIRWPAL